MYSKITYIYYYFVKMKKEKYLQTLIRNGLELGQNVSIVDTFFFDPSHCFLISIGDNCTICPNVRLIAHDASTKTILGYTKIGKIRIEENCFIGDSTIVLPNVTIGPNSIIGAGSVVTRSISPNRIAAGNPAREIGTVGAYMKKMESVRKDKKIFGEAYSIENLDAAKRNEMIHSIGNSIGFML